MVLAGMTVLDVVAIFDRSFFSQPDLEPLLGDFRAIFRGLRGSPGRTLMLAFGLGLLALAAYVFWIARSEAGTEFQYGDAAGAYVIGFLALVVFRAAFASSEQR